ncbi:TauD/TfdA family dioxygenase [Mycobacterium cookii]|uniref:Taurine catabolism dioxygenase n=2 Tax=Mycobacterium cookii TaxID=1775 RepID=A0A7I7KT05_9MYCO|nr:taurine catabolism dioxygenase [Mycobacterium cookii]
MFNVTAMTPIGARLTGVRVDTLDAASVAQVRFLLAEYGVLVLPGQHADDAGFLRFLRSFGPTMFTVGETPVPGHDELNVVSNVGRSKPPRSSFHTDTSYVAKPPAFTALRAVAVPERGGQTLFTNQYAAYDTLPVDVRQELLGRTITHVVTGLELGPDEETSATHPIIDVHPLSGRTYLYLSTPQRCARVSGMSAEQAANTVGFLFAHCTRPDNVYRHTWSPGDVVIWDNRCVMHCADHAGVRGDRVMHRGMIADVDREQIGSGPG